MKSDSAPGGHSQKLQPDKPPRTGEDEPGFRAVFLFGPTGVGKTESLLALKSGLPGIEAVNADAIQIYRGLDIGSAKADARERQAVPHHLLDWRSPLEGCNVADFVRAAEDAVTDIRRRGGIPVVTGGTGFYFKHLWYGLPESPPSDPHIRAELEMLAESRGIAELIGLLREADPVSAARIAPADRYRIIRALEVYRVSGRPLSSFALPEMPRPDRPVLALGLDRPRQELYERIDRRVGAMFDLGLIAELRKLVAGGCTGASPGMKAIGYREFFEPDAFALLQRGVAADGQLRQLLEPRIAQASRRYAKRQLTFFRALPGVRWLHPDSIHEALGFIREFMGMAD